MSAWLSPEHARTALIRSAVEAAVVLGRQLNILLDHYDFYLHRHAVEGAFEHAELRTTVLELGRLPHQLAAQLLHWRQGTEPMLSREGFELFVLNELRLHLTALATFLSRTQDLDPYDHLLVGNAFDALRTSNQLLA